MDIKLLGVWNLCNLQNTDYGRIPNNSAPRRQGAGLEIKPLDENEVDWL